MIRKIVQLGDPVLRMTAAKVDPEQIGSKEFNDLISDMKDTMRAAPGVGLAAPQIGVSLALAIVENENKYGSQSDEQAEEVDLPITVLVNPSIQLVGNKKVKAFEGCLSFAGFAAETERSHAAIVRALNEKGEECVYDWNGWAARILQHECDHLNGIVYVDRMDTRTLTSPEHLA